MTSRMTMAGLVCLCATASIAVGQGEGVARRTRVTVMACPATGSAAPGQHLMVADLGQRPTPDMPIEAIVERGEGPLNTFAMSSASSGDMASCAVVADGVVVARDVATRIPRDVCATDETLLATDLLLVETSIALGGRVERLVIARNGKSIGSVVGVAGTKILANRFGAATEKSYRASAAETLTARVRAGETGIEGREEGRETPVAISTASTGAGDAPVAEAVSGTRPSPLSVAEPFVFIAPAVCEKR